MTRRAAVERRFLHPGAWWLWAACGAVAALRTTNPLLLGLLLAVVAFVVASRRPDAPWAGAFAAALRLGILVIAIRVVFQVLFGNRLPGTTLFTLPSVDLPDWAGGVSLGGEVTLEAVVGAVYQGLRLAVVIACFAAASSLCSPYRLLRSLPSVLYEAGVAVTVALTAVPQAAVAARRVGAARRLRGRDGRGLGALRDVALPVLEEALERAIALAASMDARGYGRRGDAGRAARQLAAGLTLAGLLALAVGAYGLLDPSAPVVLGLPAMALGSAALAGALLLGGRRSARTRYRPDAWRAPEWATVLAGAAMVGGVVVAGRTGAVLDPSVQPLEVPTLPLVAAVGLLLGALPAWLTPRPPMLASVAEPGPRPSAVDDTDAVGAGHRRLGAVDLAHANGPTGAGPAPPAAPRAGAAVAEVAP